jgi:hypothetical protein
MRACVSALPPPPLRPLAPRPYQAEPVGLAAKESALGVSKTILRTQGVRGSDGGWRVRAAAPVRASPSRSREHNLRRRALPPHPPHFAGFFAGIVPCLLPAFPANAVGFVVYELVVAHLLPSDQ